MRVVALISGGKDSCFNIMHCVAQGHDIVALANLKPEGKDELDSYMYQSVGHQLVDLYAEALGIPLYQKTIKGTSVCQKSSYERSDDDEVEDMFHLLKTIKDDISYDAVSSGAILSNYQRVRVENVCDRLELQSLAYLWQRDQVELLDEMIQSELDAILIKVASLGLEPEKHLGKSLKQMQAHLLNMKEQFHLNVCGEGGEYETITLDCPLFLKKIVIDDYKMILHSDDAFAPVGYLTFQKMHLESKNIEKSIPLKLRLKALTIPSLPLAELSMGRLSSKMVSLTQLDKKNVGRGNEIEKVLTHQFSKHKDNVWISEIICLKTDMLNIEDSTKLTLDFLKSLLFHNGYELDDVVLVHLLCANMDDFSRINSVYKTYFSTNPPARVCYETLLCENEHFKMDVQLHTSKKETLHVQSISYWAPANIGPYSQAVKIDSHIFFSGSIPLIPHTMELLKTDFVQEALLSLRHVNTVSKVMSQTKFFDESGGCILCYVTDISYIEIINELFKNQSIFDPKNYHVNVVCVTRLPRNARVEWHVVSDIPKPCSCASNANRTGYCVSVNVSEEDMIGDVDETLLMKFRQHLDQLKYCHFIRIYYVISKWTPTERSLKKVFQESLVSLLNRNPVLSFVPVVSLLANVVILFHGHQYTDTTCDCNL